MKHIAVAYVIDGHHTGIPAHMTNENGESLQQTLLKFADTTERKLLTSCPESAADLLALCQGDGIAVPTPKVMRCPDAFANAMRTRMLFSCLVDADFLDTEQHFDASILPLSSV